MNILLKAIPCSFQIFGREEQHCTSKMILGHHQVLWQSLFSEESTWCEVNLRGGDKLLLGSVYRSPNSSSTNNCNLLQMFEEIEKIAPSHLVIMGGYDYKEINWDGRTCHSGLLSDPYKPLDKVTTLGRTHHITISTRHRQGQQPSLLDLILSNEENIMVKNINMLPPLSR